MEIELASVHEAGHAVVQWLVGWEPKGLQMTVIEGNATKVHAVCPHPSLDTKSAVRKRLLVLFAGNAATLRKWPESWNDWGDWQDALKAIYLHFQRPDVSKWFVVDGKKLRDPEADELLQAAMLKSKEIVDHPQIRPAIERIAVAFADSKPDFDGTVQHPGAEIVAICEADIGKAFQEMNPWSEWIAG